MATPIPIRLIQWYRKNHSPKGEVGAGVGIGILDRKTSTMTH